MLELKAWLWLPLVLYALSFGAGLLVERVARVRLPNALLPLAGLPALVVLVTPVYRLGAGASVAALLAVLAAAAGVLLSFRTLRSRLDPGWPGLAAVGAYALYLAPVALSGHWAWAGYEFVNDTSSNLVWAQQVADHGFTAPPVIDSTTARLAASPIRLNYPLGAHFLLATVRPLTGATMAAAYQPLMAALAGLAAMGFAHVGRRAGLPAAAAALAGLLAAAATLLYRYVLHGAIKEVLVVALVAAGAALAAEALSRRPELRWLAVLALAVAPLAATFSATGAAYALVLGVLAGSVLLWRLRHDRARVLAAVGIALAVALLAALPTLADTITFGRQAGKTFAESGGASTAYMGQLLRPLPLEQAAGVWLARDYRLDPNGNTAVINGALIAIVVLAALAGVVFELRRRRPAALLVLVPAAVVAAALAPLISPYADAKLLVVISPGVVLVAAVGAFALWGWNRAGRALGAIAAAALVVGILGSAAVGYREVRLSPPPKVAAMEDAAEHADGGGLWLLNEWEEYAKYFMRSIRVNSAFEAESPRPALLRLPAPLFGRYYDLDAERLAYVDDFAGVIIRRSPVASRPPASYRMTHRNRYYEVWRRRPGVRVLQHLPLQELHRAAVVPDCGDVRRLARRTRPGDRLVAAQRRSVPMLDTARARRDSGWVRRKDPPGVVVPSSPGTASGAAAVRDGVYRAWVRGSFGRPTRAAVDGRTVGAADEVNTPGQWLDVGTVSVRGGRHRLELHRGGASLRPGDAFRGVLGPLALEPVGGRVLVQVPPSRARELCGKPWDWIERVRGGA